MAVIYTKQDENLFVSSNATVKHINNYFKSRKVFGYEPNELPNVEIYKFIPLNFCLSMIRNKMLYIGRVSKWDDPYENHFFKENMYSINMKQYVGIDHMIPSTFGQCWTLTEESDALWRIYSHDSHSIRIKTSMQKLFDAVYVDDECMADTWIGKVFYMDEKDIHFHNQDNCDNYNLEEAIAFSMFMKRNEFVHENEVRVIKNLDSENTNKYRNINLLTFAINPCDFIEEICFDPRVDEPFYQNSIKQITSVGFSPSAITKSTLYDFHPSTIMLKM